jgi:hypothetical protein
MNFMESIKYQTNKQTPKSKTLSKVLKTDLHILQNFHHQVPYQRKSSQ